MNVVVIDYGMGNLRSVQKAFEKAGAGSVRITRSAEEILGAELVVLPGVGSFGAAMRNIRDFGLEAPIKAAIAAKVPFVGICLGLQVLFDSSEESPGVPGLSIFPGQVVRFSSAITKSGLKVPHMGWNQLKKHKESPFWNEIPENSYAYFVHSFVVEPKEASIVLSTTDYGGSFVSSVASDNITATQFHPEKSGETGLQMIRNLIRNT